MHFHLINCRMQKYFVLSRNCFFGTVPEEVSCRFPFFLNGGKSVLTELYMFCLGTKFVLELQGKCISTIYL